MVFSTDNGPDDLDELQADDGGLSGPIGSHMKSRRKSASQTPMAKPNGLPTPAVSKSNLCGNTSSLALLQARKHIEKSKPGSRAHRSLATAAPPPRDNRVISKSSKNNAKTPTRPQTTMPRAGQPEATGKLSSRKDRTLSQTSAGPEESLKVAGIKRHMKDAKGKQNHSVENRQIDRSQDKIISPKEGTLKLPARAQPRREAKRDAIYEISESSSAEGERLPVKKQRKSEAQASRKPVPLDVKKPGGSSARPSVEPKARSKPNKGKKPLVPEAHETRSASRGSSKVDTVRGRMKAESNSKGGSAPMSATGRESKTKSHDRNKSTTKNRTDDRVEGARETLNEFEAAVVQYGDGDQIQSEPQLAAGEPSFQSNKTKDVITEMHYTLEKGDDVGSNRERPKEGASQANAIVLSDRPPTSSPSEPASPDHVDVRPPAPPSTAYDRAKSSGLAPKTPKVFQSSPPLAPREATPRTRADPLNTNFGHKSAFISFDKSGPRNQGMRSTGKSVPGSGRTNRSSIPPAAAVLASGASSRAALQARRRQGPASTTTSMKSFKSNKSAPPINAAETVSDALASFVKKPKIVHAAETVQRSSGVLTSRVERDDEHKLFRRANEDDYAHIDDFGDTTLVDNQDVAGTSDVKPFVARKPSQIAMPPPPQALQVPNTKKPHRAPTVPSMLPAARASGLEQSAQPSPAKSTIKRSNDEEPEPAGLPATKRARNDTHSANGPSDEAKQPQMKEVVQRARHKPVLSRPEISEVPQEIRRFSRKPNRHASQGSQRVDIHGSPIPLGMVLQGRTTVLETFSQQANLSSDYNVNDATISRTPAVETKIDRIRSQEQAVPPSHQALILSSNRKRKPAERNDESQTVSRIILADPERLVIEDQADSPSTDRFTSSDENRKQPRPGSTSSTFIEQLKQQTRNKIQTAKDPHQPAEDPDITLVEPEQPIHPQKRNASLSTLSSTPSSIEADEDVESLRDLSTWRNALQPHQLKLFDELVVVSHRLVQHLVDAETAARGIVDDYCRRGENIIEQMELNHANQHRKYIDSLKARKKVLRKDFSDGSRRLKQSMAVVNELQHERKQVQENDTVARLEKLMGSHCWGSFRPEAEEFSDQQWKRCDLHSLT